MGENFNINIQTAAATLQAAAADLLHVSGGTHISSNDVLVDLERSKQLRRGVLPTDWCESPAMDIVMEVYWAQAEQRRCYIKHAVLASGVPPATATRYLHRLIAQGWILKSSTHSDRRKVLLAPSEATSDLINQWITQRKNDLIKLVSKT